MNRFTYWITCISLRINDFLDPHAAIKRERLLAIKRMETVLKELTHRNYYPPAIIDVNKRLQALHEDYNQEDWFEQTKNFEHKQLAYLDKLIEEDYYTDVINPLCKKDYISTDDIVEARAIQPDYYNK